MVALAVTGAGSLALHWLLGVPGASRTLLDAQTPYSKGALYELLGHVPERAVSTETAVQMARASFERAVRLSSSGIPVVGIGCTAAIVTDRPRRGAHRCHVAAYARERVLSYSVELAKGARDRAAEEEIVSLLVLRVIADASEVEFDLPVDLDERETMDAVEHGSPDPVSLLLAGAIESAIVCPDGGIEPNAAVEGGVLPGSYNPLHEGHKRLADAASRMLDVDVAYELSVTNVDKPPLKESEARRRIRQFEGERPVVLTRAPVFHEKARILPGRTFVIGWDTAVRVVDPRYYGDDEGRMFAALTEIREQGCRFLVAGREHDGVFHTLRDVRIPTGFEDLFDAIPETELRVDVSSTRLRAQAAERGRRYAARTRCP